MFNFFKKKIIDDPLPEYIFLFFLAVIKKLPNEFSYLLNHYKRDVSLYSKPNVYADEGWYVIGIDQEYSKQFGNLKHKSCEIKNVKVFNESTNDFEPIALFVADGFLVGYYSKADIRNLDENRINLEDMYVEYLKESSDAEELKGLMEGVSNKVKDRIDLGGIVKYEQGDEVYFKIYDLEDGMYLLIDKNLETFITLYKPFEIKPLDMKLEELFEKAEADSDFYNGIMDIVYHVYPEIG